jgi:hypothetical protein
MTGKYRPSREGSKERSREKETPLPPLLSYKRADVSAVVKRLQKESVQSKGGKKLRSRKIKDKPKPEYPDRSATVIKAEQRKPILRKLWQTTLA